MSNLDHIIVHYSATQMPQQALCGEPLGAVTVTVGQITCPACRDLLPNWFPKNQHLFESVYRCTRCGKVGEEIQVECLP